MRNRRLARTLGVPYHSNTAGAGPRSHCAHEALRLGCASPAALPGGAGADGRIPIPIPRRTDPCAGLLAPVDKTKARRTRTPPQAGRYLRRRSACTPPSCTGSSGRWAMPAPPRPRTACPSSRVLGWRRAPGSATASGGSRPDFCPCSGGERREAEGKVADEAATATALRT